MMGHTDVMSQLKTWLDTILVGQLMSYKWAYTQPSLQSRDAIIVSPSTCAPSKDVPSVICCAIYPVLFQSRFRQSSPNFCINLIRYQTVVQLTVCPSGWKITFMMYNFIVT